MLKKFTLLLLFTINFFKICDAQESNYFHYQYVFKHLSIDDGLVDNRIRTIAQDIDGFIWFGSNKGLSKFDGYSITNYYNIEKDTNSLLSNVVNNLLLDDSGNLLIATKLGLCIYNYDLDNFNGGKDNFLKKLDNIRINYLCKDNLGNIWALSGITKAFILFKINIENATIEKFDLKELYKGDEEMLFYQCIADKSNNIWISTRENGVFCFLTQEKQLLSFSYKANSNNLIKENDVASLYANDDGNIFMGYNNKGLSIYNPNTKEIKHYFPDKKIPVSGRIKQIKKDSKGNFWIGTQAGLYLFDIKSEKFKRYAYVKHPVSILKHNSIRSVFIDNNQGLWVGTFAGGVSYTHLKQTGFIKYNYSPIDNKHYLNDNNIYSLAEDKKGNIWVGTEQGGLNYLNRVTGEYIKYPFKMNDINSPRSNNIKSIVVDNKNNIWFGTYKGGVSYFNTSSKKFTHYLNDENKINSLPDNRVYKIYFDSEKTLWVGYRGGVCYKKHASDKFQIINDKSKVYKNSIKKIKVVYDIIEDKNKNIWIAAVNTLIRINLKNNELTEFNAPKKGMNPFNDISLLMEDQKSNIWIANDRKNLYLYNTTLDTFKIYNLENGVPNIDFFAMINDKSGDFWVSSDNGIYKLENLIHYPDTITYKRFDYSDNLQSKVFLYGSKCYTETGEIFFGGIKGFNSFFPENILPDKNKPSLVFTSFNVLSKKIKAGEEIDGKVILKKSINESEKIRLNHKITVFTIEFAAIHYLAPEQNKYKYIMDGYDDHWTEVDASKRFATYSKLPAGNYTFKVMGSNKDDVWNPEPITIKITIIPPFWKTWWFRLMVVVFVTGGVIAFYLIRINQIKKQKIYLERQVEIRTHELKEANVDLRSKQEEILAQNEEIQQQSEEITAQRDAVSAQNEEIKTKNDQITKAYDNIKILSEFGQRITAQLNLNAINSMIYNYVNSLMDVSAFGIGIYNEKHNEIVYTGYMEEGKPLPAFANKLTDKNSLSAWCLTNNKEIVINDYEKDFKKYISGEIPVFTKKRPESFLYVPLVADNKKIGVMTAQSYKKNAYSDTDLTNMQSLASYITIALDNANFYDIVNRQNKKITSSIEYAKNIQNSILPIKENIDKHFESFIIFRPKDIVSGDFYWYTTARNEKGKEYVFIAAIDCTGHGVPGAFMSLIGYRILNEVVNQRNIHNTAQILEYLNIGVQLSLKQEQTGNNDGMDACLVRLENGSSISASADTADKSEPAGASDESKTSSANSVLPKASAVAQASTSYAKASAVETVKIMYTGAKNSLYYSTNNSNDLQKLDSDRKSIGGIRARRSKISYTYQEIELNKNDMLYLSTDGIVDQNGPERNKYGTKRFVELLGRINILPMYQQKDAIETELMVFMNEEDQRDDITLIGVKL